MNMNTHPKMKNIYVGIDCHKSIHVASIINCFNEKYNSITINNDKKGFESLIKMVNEYKQDLNVVYGIEDTNHYGYELTSYLLSQNCNVKCVNGTLTANERKKRPIIIKNDIVDSECIAKVLLDELDNLPNVKSEEIYWTLKQLVKMRTSIVSNNIKVKNKLHAQLLHHYPYYNKLFSRIDIVTSLNFFETYPNPDLLLKEDFEILVSNIKTWSKYACGIKKASKILEIVKENELEKNNTYQEDRNFVIKMLVNQIKDNNKRLEEIEEKIINIYDKLECKLHTFPCMSKLTSACMLAQIGNINRFSNSSKLAKYAGIAPIEVSSGGKDKALKNEFGNRDLNCMFYYLACRSICISKNGETLFNPIFKEYYYKKIQEGKTKHQAIICIMKRTCNIIYKMLKNNIEYKTPTELIEECNNSFRERKKLEEEKNKKKKI